MKDRFVAVLDIFCLRQALKESNKMCDVCGEMVPLKEAFHHREKHKLDVRECCGMKLPSEKAARRHMNLYHNKNKELTTSKAFHERIRTAMRTIYTVRHQVVSQVLLTVF